MVSLSEVLSFEPMGLIRARQEVVEQHPSIAQLVDLAPTDPDALRRRVEAASPEPAELVRLARGLTPRELTFVARSMGEWVDLREAVAVIVRTRPKAGLVPALWRSVEGFPHEDLIWTVLRETLDAAGEAALLNMDLTGDLPEVLRASVPPDAFVEWMDRRRISVRELEGVPHSPFRGNTPLLEFIRERLLIVGSRRQIQSIDESTLTAEWRRLGPIPRMEACRHYLAIIPPDEWLGSLPSYIREAYGMPEAPGSMARFWDPVADEIRRAFRRRFIAEELEKAFAGDTERHEYWARWGDRDMIRDIRRGRAGQTDWARLEFGGFSVLEFFTVGNAAYFLPADMVKQVPWNRATSERDLKLRLEPSPVPRYPDNRLTHHRGWQIKADRMMHDWQRHFG